MKEIIAETVDHWRIFAKADACCVASVAAFALATASPFWVGTVPLWGVGVMLYAAAWLALDSVR